MRTDVPESFRSAILAGIEEGEKRVKLGNKIKAACAAAAVVCVIAGLAALGLEPMQDVTSPVNDIVTSAPQAEVYITDYGAYYHTVSGCSGLEGAQAASKETAEEQGKLPCPVCAGGEAPSQDTETAETEADVPVYATKGGMYYHSVSGCSGMINAEQTTLALALSQGKTACPYCMTAERTGAYMNPVYEILEKFAPGAPGCLNAAFGPDNMVTEWGTAIDGMSGGVRVNGTDEAVVTLYIEAGAPEMTFKTDAVNSFAQNLLDSLEDGRVKLRYKSALEAINRYFGYDVQDSIALCYLHMAFDTGAEMTDLQFVWEGNSKLILAAVNPATGEIYSFSVQSPG